MKKIYIKPLVKVHLLELSCSMLALSNTDTDDYTGGGTGGPTGGNGGLIEDETDEEPDDM